MMQCYMIEVSDGSVTSLLANSYTDACRIFRELNPGIAYFSLQCMGAADSETLEEIKLPLRVSSCGREILDADGVSFAYLCFRAMGYRDPKAVRGFREKADLIVLAVNAHESIVNQLELSLSHLDQCPRNNGTLASMIRANVEALAEGKP